MEVHASVRFARIAPRKARLVAHAIRGIPVAVAEVRLQTLDQRAAPMLLKLVRSAVANARHNFQLEPNTLTVARVLVNEGPRLKRVMPRARGAAARIQKRTSHIEVVLASAVGTPQSVLGKKTTIETKKVEELKPDELRAATAADEKKVGGARDRGAVKKPAAPRSVRKLFDRKSI